MLDRGKELGDVKSENGSYHVLLPAQLYVVDQHLSCIDCRVLLGGPELVAKLKGSLARPTVRVRYALAI